MSLLLKIIASLTLLMAGHVHAQTDIAGAGSSLSYPVMKELTKQYQAQKNIKVSYSSVGSGEGIVQMAARVVDFSLSDIPLTQYELNSQNLLQFPVFASAIVPVFNLPGIEKGQLKLSGTLLADIYLGRVTQWNDRAILELNPGKQLPQLAIKVIYRSDISGSSYVLTSYLSKASVHWNTHYGIGSKLKWPVGEGVKGSAGVEQAVKAEVGSISYLEYGAATTASLNIANLVVNGKTAVANVESFASAFDALSPVRPSFYQFTMPSPNLDYWPIIAITYALVSKKPSEDDEVKESLSFFNWVYQHGAPTVRSFNLLPVTSKKTLSSIAERWRTIKDPKGQAIWSEGVLR